MATKKYLDYAGLKRVLKRLLPGARKIWHGTEDEWEALSETERDEYDQAEVIDGVDKRWVLETVYPVGSLYWSSNPKNPGEIFGGTWEQIKDKFIFAAGDSHEVNETGGNETVTLEEKNLPAHTHSFTPSGTISTADTSHSHSGGVYLPDATDIGFAGGVNVIRGFNKVVNTFDDNARYKAITVNTSSQSHSHTFTGSAGTTGTKGESNAFSIMPPYETKYCWERIA